jgi:RNA chaperone Hfq
MPAPPPNKAKAPEHTYEEAKYLRHLIENRIPVRVCLTGGEQVSGIIEFFDISFIRVTREDGPNLFLFKHDIKYLYELS